MCLSAGENGATSARLQAFGSDSEDGDGDAAASAESDHAPSLPPAAVAERAEKTSVARAAQAAARPSAATAAGTASTSGYEAPAGEGHDEPALGDTSDEAPPGDSQAVTDDSTQDTAPSSPDSDDDTDEDPDVTAAAMPAQQQKQQQQLQQQQQQQQQQQPIGTSKTLLASEALELSSDSSGGHPAVPATSHASLSEGSSQGDCAEGMESLNQRAVVAVGSELALEHLSEHGEETSSAEADIAAVSSACAADSGDHGGRRGWRRPGA